MGLVVLGAIGLYLLISVAVEAERRSTQESKEPGSHCLVEEEVRPTVKKK